jgi:hypothetical protein
LSATPQPFSRIRPRATKKEAGEAEQGDDGLPAVAGDQPSGRVENALTRARRDAGQDDGKPGRCRGQTDEHKSEHRLPDDL